MPKSAAWLLASDATVTVRDGLPTTAISCDGGACAAGFVKGPVSVALSATDGGGGLGATRYTLDGSDPSDTSPQFTAPLTLTDTTTVKFRSWDAAGNAEAVQTQALKIDGTPAFIVGDTMIPGADMDALKAAIAAAKVGPGKTQS